MTSKTAGKQKAIQFEQYLMLRLLVKANTCKTCLCVSDSNEARLTVKEVGVGGCSDVVFAKEIGPALFKSEEHTLLRSPNNKSHNLFDCAYCHSFGTVYAFKASSGKLCSEFLNSEKKTDSSFTTLYLPSCLSASCDTRRRKAY